MSSWKVQTWWICVITSSYVLCAAVLETPCCRPSHPHPHPNILQACLPRRACRNYKLRCWQEAAEKVSIELRLIM